nr:MAG TPA: hypothetical protein [Caudoviricetes sp.]
MLLRNSKIVIQLANKPNFNSIGYHSKSSDTLFFTDIYM